MKWMDNTLDLRVVLAVYDARADLLRLESDRLSWISAAGPSSSLLLRTIVEEHILPPFNNGEASLEDIKKAIQNASARLQTQLQQEYSIFCELRLHFLLEEQAEEALAKLCTRLKFQDVETAGREIKAACSLGAVDFKNVIQTAIANATKVSAKNFTIESSEIDVLPGKGFALMLASEKPVICREFQFFCREHLVLEYQTPANFDANSRRTIQFPAISVGMYRHLLCEQTGTLRLHLILDGRDAPIGLDTPIRHPSIVLNQKPISLFLDVGSSFSKFMVAEIESDISDTAIDRSTLSSLLRATLSAAINGSADRMALDVPQETTAFLTTYGLSHVRKEDLDQYEDDELAAHFSRSVNALATRFYERENRLLSEVFWAFPNTRQRDFTKINESANQMLKGGIMGTLHIVPEADCLRLEFAGPLHALAEAAKDAIQQTESAEESNRKAHEAEERIRHAWQEFHNLPFYHYKKLLAALTNNRPTNPRNSGVSFVDIPTLEDWHREFAKLNCSSDLSQFLVFDAGGYSLDVYGSLPDIGEDISQSFPAGSARINIALIEQLKKDTPDRDEHEYVCKSEEIKCSVCGDPDSQTLHPLYQICKTITVQIYAHYIDTVLALVAEQIGARGLPIILTGGASRNQFLQQLMNDKVSELNMRTVPVNTFLLYSTMHQARGFSSPKLRLFQNIASAFNPHEEVPRMAPETDILGGLAQRALST